MRVGLIAGESSGDLLGAGLIREIRRLHPDAQFEGVAGPAMLEAGCDHWADAEELAVMGLIEPLRHIPRLLRLRRSLVDRWKDNPPDVFVGIDAPDFNLGVETRLRAAGIPTVHYVSPTVWAWRSGRIKTIRKAVDRVLCLLPFEKQFLVEHGVDAVFVGHPKAGTLSPDYDVTEVRRSLGLPAAGSLVGLLPGSRGSEVSRLAPAFAEAGARLASEVEGLTFAVPVVSQKLLPLIEDAVEAAGIGEKTSIVEGRSLDVMRASDVVLQASGTAVLEAALLGTPAVAAYTVAPFTAWLVRTFRLINLDYFTIPNLLTDEPLVPEFIQEAASPENLAGAVRALLDDPARRESIRSEFAKLHGQLALNADRRAAAAVVELHKPKVEPEA